MKIIVRPPVSHEPVVNMKNRPSLDDMLLIRPAELELERLCMKNGSSPREAMKKSVDARLKNKLISWYKLYLAQAQQPSTQADIRDSSNL